MGTERLSKAERDVCRKRWEHPCDLEPERHACTIIDLLNDLDALERERDDLKRQLEDHGIEQLQKAEEKVAELEREVGLLLDCAMVASLVSREIK